MSTLNRLINRLRGFYNEGSSESLTSIEPEVIYQTIPADYACIYYRILHLLADYGEEMLMDCKANCTDRSTNVIECFNMFNSAVAAKSIGKIKLAETIIKYVKAKLDQIAPIDETVENLYPIVTTLNEDGETQDKIIACLSCNGTPKIKYNESTTTTLYVGAGAEYNDIYTTDYKKEEDLSDTFKLEYDISVETTGDKIFILIPSSYQISKYKIDSFIDNFVDIESQTVTLDGVTYNLYTIPEEGQLIPYGEDEPYHLTLIIKD